MALDISTISRAELHVDCSSHNGVPDLQRYWDDGHRHLVLKATEGTGYVWPGMASLAQRWHALGGTCGYYHWLYATKTGLDQYNWFWNNIRPVFHAGDEIMVDFEDVDPSRWTDDATHLAVLKDFTARCAVNAQVCIYTGNWYLSNLPLTVVWLKATQMVQVSDYSNWPPRNPYGLTYCGVQFTDRAKVAGFANPVDYNRRLIVAPVVTPTTPPEISVADAQAILDAIAALKVDLTNKINDAVTNVNLHVKAGTDDVNSHVNARARENAALETADDAVINDTGKRVAELQAAVKALADAEAAEPGSVANVVDPKALVAELGAALTRGEASV